MARKQPPPVRLKSGIMTSSDAPGTVQVQVEGSTLRARLPSHVAYSAGKVAQVIVRGQSAHVIGITGTAVSDPQDPPATIVLPGERNGYADPRPQADVIRPIFTGSFHGSGGDWWTRGMWQGVYGGGENTGVLFLGGNAPLGLGYYQLPESEAFAGPGLIRISPPSPLVLTIRLHLERLPGGPDVPLSPRIFLGQPGSPATTAITPQTQTLWPLPAAAVTPAESWAPGQAHTITLPAEWGQYLFRDSTIGIGGAADLPALGFAGHKSYLIVEGN